MKTKWSLGGISVGAVHQKKRANVSVYFYFEAYQFPNTEISKKHTSIER